MVMWVCGYIGDGWGEEEENETIGNTPIVRLATVGSTAQAKLEYTNPGGSIKDRVAQRILSNLKTANKIKDSTTVLVVPSSGNLVISLALLSPRNGRYKVIGLVPERTSQDRIQLLKSLGVEIVRTPIEAHADAAESQFSIAKKIATDLPEAILIDEFVDRAAVQVHAEETAAEIAIQCEGRLDAIVIGVETGGTITGLAGALKSKIPGLVVVGVEPEHSAIQDGVSRSGAWKVEDIGGNFTPAILEKGLIDQWIQISDQVSYSTARQLIREEGVFGGPSSGSVVAAALQYAKALNKDTKPRILTIMNDTARNYSSTLLSDDWLLEHDLMDETMARSAAYHRHEKYRAASVEELQLPAAVTIPPTASVGYALDLMMTREFSQLPVLNPTNRKLMGYISLTSLTTLLEDGRAKESDHVSQWMYSFLKKNNSGARSTYETITPMTPLADLAKFFEKHSFAVVTDDDRRCAPMALPLSKIRDLSFKTSIYGIEERIVLDIGSCYLKCGFSGEARPRHFLPLFLTEEALDDYLGLKKPNRAHVGQECGEICNEKSHESCHGTSPYEYAELYELDMMRKNSRGQSEQERLQILEERLSEYLYDVYFKYLLTDPKQRKVIICESPLAPIALKQAIARVLFDKLQVPSISFTPSHLLALLTTGTATGLVIDCGHLETSVLPIYSSRPLTPFIRTTPRAGKFLSSHLKQLLRDKCPISLAANPTDLRIIPEGMLTSSFLETIKCRLLFASPLIINATDNNNNQLGEDEMNDNYRDVSTSTEVNVEVWLEEEQARGILAIPGWIRERACECLFNGDEDAESLTDCILEAVSKSPSDLRRPLISSLLLIGGTAQLPNLQNRLLQEIKRSLQMNKRWKHLSGLADSVRFLDDLTAADEAATTAAAAAAAAGSAAQTPSDSSLGLSGSAHVGRSTSQQSMMDIDPGSPASTTTTSTTDRERERRKKREQGKKAYQSSGKVFSPNCRGWIGGSLVGSLKSSGPELLRENFNGSVPDWSTSISFAGVGGSSSSNVHGTAQGGSLSGSPSQQQMDTVASSSLVASALAILY
ncbi:hypothetical protein BG004_000218 [Podila humilis]|nr:hypothetical protein BG004_000218 [Podila humilis]